jgi:hypothetical protein
MFCQGSIEIEVSEKIGFIVLDAFYVIRHII